MFWRNKKIKELEADNKSLREKVESLYAVLEIERNRSSNYFKWFTNSQNDLKGYAELKEKFRIQNDILELVGKVVNVNVDYDKVYGVEPDENELKGLK